MIIFLFFSTQIPAEPFYNFLWPKNDFPLRILCRLHQTEGLKIELNDINLVERLKKEGIPKLDYSIKFSPATKGYLKFSRSFLGEQHLEMEVTKEKGSDKLPSYRLFHKYFNSKQTLIDKGEQVFDPNIKKSWAHWIQPKDGFVYVICLINYRSPDKKRTKD